MTDQTSSEEIDKNTLIYGLIDPRSDEIRYIGKSTQPSIRYRTHIWRANAGYVGHKEAWIRSMIRDGVHPELISLEWVSDSETREKEKSWVKFGRDSGWDLTNETEGGEGVIKHSQDTRENLSRALKGRKFSDEHRRKLKEARSNGNWKLSEKGREALIKRNKEHPLSGENLEKLINSRKGKKNTPEHNAKISLARTGMRLSDETRKKISEAAKKRKPRTNIPEEERKRRSEAAKLWWKKRKEGEANDSTADSSI